MLLTKVVTAALTLSTLTLLVLYVYSESLEALVLASLLLQSLYVHLLFTRLDETDTKVSVAVLLSALGGRRDSDPDPDH